MKTTSRVAALIAATALSLSLTAPAAIAADQPRGQSSAQAAQAQKAPKSKTVKSLKRSLAKAKTAEKKARAQVAAATSALSAAQAAGAGTIATYNSAVAGADQARAAHTPAKTALDRAQYVIANENALWNAWNQKMNAVEVGYKPLRDANTAANQKVSDLRAAREAIRAQRDTASANQSAAATVAGNLNAYDIPAAQDQYNAALGAENNAWNAKEAARIDFANRKAQWDNVRKVDGKWQGLRNGTWRFVPGLDDAEALLEQRQQQYNQAKDHRQNVEAYLNQLNSQLAAVQADIQYWYGVFMALNDQYNAAQGPLDAAVAAATATATAMNAYFNQNVKPLYNEAEALSKEISTAKKNLPALVAAEKPLADAVTQAVAALDAATPAYQAVQAPIASAEAAVSASTAEHATTTKKVKAAKKKLKKALKKRR